MLAAVGGDGCGCPPWFIVSQIVELAWCRFIIDGVITLPIALYGFLVFPDTPATTKSFYLSEEVRFP